MKVRGISILTRKAIVTRKFGADAWAVFFADIARAHPRFLSPISANSLVPLPEYLSFHDELVRRFFDDSETSHFQLGQESARWALTEGPYKQFMEKQDINQMVTSFPKLWDAYFFETASRSEATLEGNTVDFKVLGLPRWHPYFEHFIVGYMKEVLELFCANPIAATRLSGGGKDYHYLLAAAPPAPAAAARAQSNHVRDGSTPSVAHSLSDREIEVLRLVARGLTNKQIGLELGISCKTVQHHVAHAYGKLGVSGRVDAAMWLAHRGLVGQ